MDRIFDSATNPNAIALVVPQEEGGVDGDHYFGSIGDATARHVNNLDTSDRQLWEGLITTKNGAIFRTEPSPMWHDPDPFNLQGKDMQKYFEKIRRDNKGRFIPHHMFDHLQEAIEEEAEKQKRSEDVYDRTELLPYEQLEKFPGMMKHIDVPRTPKDMLLYMGNTEQKFYDQFPEGAPDAWVVNAALQILNQPWEKLTESYLNWFQDWLTWQNLRPFTLKYLSELADEIGKAEREPCEAAAEALEKIDKCARTEYMNTVAQRMIREDSIYMMIMKNKKEWVAKTKAGQSVYSSVKAFGRNLFEALGKEKKLVGRDDEPVQEYVPVLRRHHWDLYRRIKKQFSPKLMIRGKDVNRAGLSDLKKIFGEKAEDVWFGRPFENIHHLRAHGFVVKEVFSTDETSEQIMSQIDRAGEFSRQVGNLGPLNDYRVKLITSQKRGIKDFTGWSQVWAYYNVLRGELVDSFRTKEEKPTREQLVEQWLKEHTDDQGQSRQEAAPWDIRPTGRHEGENGQEEERERCPEEGREEGETEEEAT